MYWWLHGLGLCGLSLSSKQQNNHNNNDNQIIKPALVAACIGTGEDPEIADKELDSWPACYNVVVNNEYCLIKMIVRDGGSIMELDIIKIVIIPVTFSFSKDTILMWIPF